MSVWPYCLISYDHDWMSHTSFSCVCVWITPTTTHPNCTNLTHSFIGLVEIELNNWCRFAINLVRLIKWQCSIFINNLGTVGPRRRLIRKAQHLHLFFSDKLNVVLFLGVAINICWFFFTSFDSTRCIVSIGNGCWQSNQGYHHRQHHTMWLLNWMARVEWRLVAHQTY